MKNLRISMTINIERTVSIEPDEDGHYEDAIDNAEGEVMGEIHSLDDAYITNFGSVLLD